MGIHKPPVDRSLPWLELRREIKTEDVEVTYPNGNSYDLTLEEARMLLMQMGVPELPREKALDKLWNFYAIKFHLLPEEEYRVETLEPPQYPAAAGPHRPLEPYQWLFDRPIIQVY